MRTREEVCGVADRIGVGMVGAGSIARARHVPGLKAIEGVELVGVVNRSPESSEEARQALGFARTYASWRELLDDRKVDAVVVATWPYLHAPITLAALDAGKHVLTQARMAMNAGEAQDMLDASLEHPDLTTMIVPAPTSYFADRTVQRLLGEGALGTLRTARVVWGGSVSGGAADPWRRQTRYSGNNIMAVGILYECLARWLGHARWVQATTGVYDHVEQVDGRTNHLDVPDFVAIQTAFPGGVQTTIEIAAHTAADSPNRALLFGSDATLRIDFDARTIALARMGSTTWTPVEPRKGEVMDWRVEEEFVGAIRGTEQVRLTDFATGVRYMRFTDAVNEAAETGQRVTP
jgi:predicted dehydrogenase